MPLRRCLLHLPQPHAGALHALLLHHLQEGEAAVGVQRVAERTRLMVAAATAVASAATAGLAPL